jgi:hypothetical protein
VTRPRPQHPGQTRLRPGSRLSTLPVARQTGQPSANWWCEHCRPYPRYPAIAEIPWPEACLRATGVVCKSCAYPPYSDPRHAWPDLSREYLRLAFKSRSQTFDRLAFVVTRGSTELLRLQGVTVMQLLSTITCPECDHASTETMPTDACLYFYNCKGCGHRMKPKPRSCCVFCSYGDVLCPPIQEELSCCSRTAAE